MLKSKTVPNASISAIIYVTWGKLNKMNIFKNGLKCYLIWSMSQPHTFLFSQDSMQYMK